MQAEVTESTGKQTGSFFLWSDAPKWEYSTAPLAYPDGLPMDKATAGAGGHAIYLSDQQVRFWMSMAR